MSKAFGAGQAAAANGGVAPPRQPTHQQQNQADTGFRTVRTQTPPPPSDPKR